MKGKIIRVLAILVVMMMAFALMPAQTALAYQEGDTCPYCHSGILVWMGASDTTHFFQCNNTECIYRDGYFLVEDHWGGVATCTEVARCKGCMNPQNMEGTPYGDLDPDNHVNIVVDAAVAATCTEAGKTEGQHCGDCGKVLEKQTEVKALGHKGGTATCTAKAVCETCGQEYGEVLGHKWGAWTVTKEATTSEEGIETRVCSNDSSHTETRKIAKKEETKKEEPKKEAAKAETVSKTTDTQPQTGDESQTVWVVMMMLSAAILIVLAIRKRRVFD